MDLPALLHRYFDSLEAGDFSNAAVCFTDSARYSHPPYADEPPGAPRHEALGSEEILRLFERRGTRTTRHEVTAIAQTGARCFISGIVKDSVGGRDEVVASFVSEAVVDEAASQFVEYVAYSSRPAVWAHLDARGPTSPPAPAPVGGRARAASNTHRRTTIKPADTALDRGADSGTGDGILDI